MSKKGMYKDTDTWSPFKGCKFDCVYCDPSFKAQAKRQKPTIDKNGRPRGCLKCYNYEPHEHPERLARFPSSKKFKIVFVAGNGDINFARKDYVKKMIDAIKHRNIKFPDIVYYFQSKNPKTLKQHLKDLPSNAIAVTTLETNRDKDYKKISKAPKPSKRYKDFKKLKWDNKVVTIEPVMDFDEDIFLQWIKEINPLYVWIGYNSRRGKIHLTEPTKSKFQRFITKLQNNNITVKIKYIP